MDTISENERLPETYSSRKSANPRLFPASSGAWTCADSAHPPSPLDGPDRPQADRGSPASGFAEAPFGTKLIPDEMGFLVFFRGSQVRLLTPAGERCTWLSHGLSLLHLRVCNDTARKYAHALRRFLDAARANAGDIADLACSETAAERALRRLLTKAGCKLHNGRRAGGGIIVHAPPDLACCIDTALTTLSACYDLLADRGELDFANPIAPRDLPASRFDDDSRRRPRHFLVANRPRSQPRVDDPHCSSSVLEAARQWPPGIAAAAQLTASQGDRISETLELQIRDWARWEFGDRIACTNKGSKPRRTKTLYLDAQDQAELESYVDGDRKRLTGLGLAELKRIARTDPGHPALDRPLFLNTRGRAISYSLFNGHYFAPSLRALGSPATPHWLRHEKATDGLLAIEQIARGEAEKEQMVDTYASLLGWRTGKEMLFYYAGSIADRQRRELASRLAAARRAAEETIREPRAARPAPHVPLLFDAFLAGRLP